MSQVRAWLLLFSHCALQAICAVHALTQLPVRYGHVSSACLPEQGAYNALVGAGITFFDTSDVYGYKSSEAGLSAEHLLGRFAEENNMVSGETCSKL